MTSGHATLRRTLRRVGAVAVVLLAGLLYVSVHSAEAYRIGRLYNSLLGWTSVVAFWTAFSYLLVSAGLSVADSTSSNPSGGDADRSSS